MYKVPENKFVDYTTTEQNVTADVTNYDTARATVAVASPVIADAMPDFCSIDLGALEQFVQYAKIGLQSAGAVQPAIKFKFAKYPNVQSDPKANPAYAGKIHIVLQPADMATLGEADLDGLVGVPTNPNIQNLKQLNYMNITPPF